jgi:hypothetical protein
MGSLKGKRSRSRRTQPARQWQDDFAPELTRMRPKYEAVVRQFCPTWDGEPDPSWRDYPALPADAPIEVINALAAVQLIDVMLHGQPRLPEDFAHWYAALKTIETDKQLQPLYQLGLTVREQRRKGAKTTNALHAEQRSQYQAEVDQLMADGKSYTAACQQVASSRGVSDRTVRDNTTNPNPRNRGRWQR